MRILKQTINQLLIAVEKNQYGIEALKLIEHFKANFIKEIWKLLDETINQGKKPSIFLTFRFFDDFADLSEIIRKREEIGKEYKDLTKEELLELDSVFKGALDLDQVNKEGFDVEEFAERTNFVIAAVSDYVFYLISLKE